MLKDDPTANTTVLEDEILECLEWMRQTSDAAIMAYREVATSHIEEMAAEIKASGEARRQAVLTASIGLGRLFAFVC